MTWILLGLALLTVWALVEAMLASSAAARAESRVAVLESRLAAVKSPDEQVTPSPEPGVYLLSDGEAAAVEQQQLAASRQRASGIAVRSAIGRRGSERWSVQSP